MNIRIKNVLDSIKRWHDSPKAVATETTTAGSLDGGNMPPPQVTWLLLGLIHYRRRKKWAWSLYEQHRAQVPALTVGEVCEQKEMKFVPGHPEWSYELHSNDSHVVNRSTGEDIHFDTCNGVEVISAYWYLRYLQKFRTPGPAERRIKELFPRQKGAMAGLNYLRTHRVLDWVYDAETWRMSFKLAGEVRRYAGPVKKFLDAWKNPKNRLRLGALIGDWEAVHLAARAKKRPDIAAHAEKLAAGARDCWLSRLRTYAEVLPSSDTLHALAIAKAADLPAYLASALVDPELAGAAIRIIGDDPAWCCQVTEAFKESLRAYWRYEARGRAAKYLARQGHPIDELLDGVVSKPADYRAATQLAMQYSPERLPDLLRRSLRSKRSRTRLFAAAVLASIGNSWACRELMAAVKDADFYDRTLEARCALQVSGSMQAQKAMRKWEKHHASQVETTDVFSDSDYEMCGGCQTALRDTILKVDKMVCPLRPFFAKQK